MSIKGTGNGPLPPLLEQYVKLRDEHADYLLLFQVGEFYEAFGEDAERLARALGLTLTHKSSRDFTTPMAGIPMRAADVHIERLLKLGFRVGVADQVEDANLAQGLVERQVTQLVTPGTITDETLLRGDENYLAAVATGDGYGLALLDISTGEFRCCQLASRGALYDELARIKPAEILLAPELNENQTFLNEFSSRFSVMRSSASFDLAQCEEILVKQFTAVPIESDALKRAAGAILSYANRVGNANLASVRRLSRFDPGTQMWLDETALRALEIFEPIRGEDQTATLFFALNLTRTAAGRRRLRSWLRAPLLDISSIEARLDAVEFFYQNAENRNAIRGALYRGHDLERLSARVASNQANPRDLVALKRTLELVPEIVDSVQNAQISLLGELTPRLDSLPKVIELINLSLVDSPPLRLSDGGLIRDGFDAELDQYRQTALEHRTWIAALEESERIRTGISSLKVGFNGVFGYYLEVTSQYLPKVPSDYRQIQTLKDRSRYTRADLRERERAVLRAEEQGKNRELAVFNELKQNLVAYSERLQSVATALAELDVLSSLAEAALERDYVRPSFVSPDDFIPNIELARHPVVELAKPGSFVANDLKLQNEKIILLTGPNMSGKSTYLRQIALISLMAQIGSFVPAKKAVLPIFDRIYTRIGASDDLAGGASTFMVEMKELATILHGASEKSLIILDEVGRGTSTFDGLSIAQAACEFLHKTGALTLYATHYFELTALENKLPGVRNFHVAALEEEAGLTFYHQVQPGPASKSYGVQVAKLAGLPPEVINRAENLLKSFESNSEDAAKIVTSELLALDLSRLTPLEALSKLQELQNKLN